MERFLGSGNFCLQLGNAPVLDLRSLVQIAGALRLFHQRFGFLELLIQDADRIDRGFFILPLRLKLRRLFLQIRQILLDPLQALPRSLVLFLFQRGLLDFQLHDLPIELVDLRRQGIQFHPQTRGCLVHQIHRLVGKKTIRNVTMRERRRRHQRRVLDANAMVDFIPLLQSPQNGNRRFHRRFLHEHRLKPALEGGILFDVLAVFIECGRANAAEFAAGELRLEHVGGIRRAFGRASAHDRVKLVNKENDPAFTGGDLLEKCFQAIFKFAAILGASDHRAEVHGDQFLVLKRFRHIAADNSPGQAFGDGGLADAGFADQNRIVFGASG